jgi:hypothetical protein
MFFGKNLHNTVLCKSFRSPSAKQVNYSTLILQHIIRRCVCYAESEHTHFVSHVSHNYIENLLDVICWGKLSIKLLK